MKKHKLSFISYLLVATTMLIGYTQCNCKPASPTSDPDPASDNTDKPPIITQAMIDQVKADLPTTPKLQFLVERLEKLRQNENGKPNIDLTDVNWDGFTALHQASYMGYPAIVAALLKLEANAELNNNAENLTALNLAICKNNDKGQAEIIDVFLNDPHIADFINIPDSTNKTPLANVIDNVKGLNLTNENQHPKILKWLTIKQKLIDKGATTI